MPKGSASKKAPNAPPLPFKSEAEEAEWFRSAAGRRYSERQFERAAREGKVMRGLRVKATDAAVLQELVDRVAAKRTQSVSLRIPVRDIEAAKKVATETGLGYQTVLKEIISKALRNDY
jgi:L-rhamnose isomerase